MTRPFQDIPTDRTAPTSWGATPDSVGDKLNRLAYVGVESVKREAAARIEASFSDPMQALYFAGQQYIAGTILGALDKLPGKFKLLGGAAGLGLAAFSLKDDLNPERLSKAWNVGKSILNSNENTAEHINDLQTSLAPLVLDGATIALGLLTGKLITKGKEPIENSKPITVHQSAKKVETFASSTTTKVTPDSVESKYKASEFSFVHEYENDHIEMFSKPKYAGYEACAKQLGRLGNFRYQYRNLEKLDELNGGIITSRELVRAYDVPGYKTKIVVPDNYARVIRQSRDVELGSGQSLRSGYKPCEYKVTSAPASKITMPPLQSNDAKKLFETGSRIFPGNEQRMTVVLKQSNRQSKTAHWGYNVSEELAGPGYLGDGPRLAGPEHLAAQLVGLPNPNMVSEMRLYDHVYAHQEPGKITHATAQGRIIEYYKASGNGKWLNRVTNHEFAHVFDNWVIDQEYYADAVRVEEGLKESGFNMRHYGTENCAENFAVHAEGLLSPDASEMIRALDPGAYLRTAVFARRLKNTVERQPGGELSKHSKEYLRRISHIEWNIRPKAVESLVEACKAENPPSLQQVRLLGYLGDSGNIQHILSLAERQDWREGSYSVYKNLLKAMSKLSNGSGHSLVNDLNRLGSRLNGNSFFSNRDCAAFSQEAQSEVNMRCILRGRW